MGQYYRTIFLDGKGNIRAWLNAHSFQNGVKLMEHSYIGNNFVGRVEWLLSPLGFFHSSSLVWAGDYAEVESSGENLHGMCDLKENEDLEILQGPSSFNAAEWPYLVNHTKQQYVLKSKGRGDIHPLPILTAEGNGAGGGDYRGKNDSMAGIWARDVISVEKEVPEGYTELEIEFEE